MQTQKSINDRRRRSGALHAQTCEEYLKKYDQIGQMVLRESTRKKSLTECAFLNFDFIPNDAVDEDISKLKILIYTPKLKINEEEFLQILKRVRNRSITTDNIPKKSVTFDYDFFYREYEVNEKHYGLHFWVQNNVKTNYYKIFDAVVLFQRDLSIEQKIKDLNPNCVIKFFPLLDELLVEPLQTLIAEICHNHNKS